MNPPTYRKEVQQFIVNYYWDMWTSISHTLAPIPRIMFNKIKWTKTVEN